MKNSPLMVVQRVCVFALLLNINSLVLAAPIIDISVTANGDTTYTYDIAVTNNNSGELYFFGVDIDHISYDLNGWNPDWMNGTWSNSSYGGDSDPYSTAWVSGASIATGDTLSGFSFTSYDYVINPRVFAWNVNMTGSEDTNLFYTTSNRGWESYADVKTVPIPAAAWLFSSGLLGLIGVARMKAA